MFVAETKRARAVVMGRKTFDTIGKPLPGRYIVVMTRTVPSPKSSPLEGEEQKNVGGGGTVEYTREAPNFILKKLAEQGFTEVIVAGGPTINALFLNAGLITEIKLTIEPKLFGRGLSLFEGVDTDVNLELIECKNLTPNVLWVHYKIL